jgi:hypothetical protein
MAEPNIFSDEDALAQKKAAAAASGGDAENIYGGLPPAGFTAPQPDPVPVYHGALLPFSRDSSGHVYFDPTGAGPLAAIKHAFTLPGRVMSGETPMPSTFDPAANDPNTAPMMGELLNFAGAFGPGVNPMVRSGDPAIPGVRMAPKDMTLAKTPSSAELLAKGGDQIEAFKNMDIKYDPSYMGTLATQIEQKLVNEGVFPEDAPGLYQSIRRLNDYVPRSDDPSATISVGPANLISIRKNIANKFGQAGENQHGVGVAHGAFNDFLENPPAEAVLAGAPATASAGSLDNQIGAALGASIYKEGRGNYSAGMRDAELERIQREAGLRSRSANSGQNLDNSIRSRVTSAILNAKALKGFTPAEEAMLEQVPEGSVGNNILRWTGNFMGGGGGLGAGAAMGLSSAGARMLGLGEGASSAIGMAVPAIGAALKKATGKSTSEALSEVQQATRQRSPMFEQSLPGQDLFPDPGVTPRDTMARTLMQMYSEPQGVPVSEDDTASPRRVIIDTTNLP